MNRARREWWADWLTVIGAAALLASLFLTWSHQFSPAFLAQYGSSPQLQGVAHDPSAWQVYSVVDVLLAVLAAGLLIVALVGRRSARLALLLASILALVFVVHALGHPPTNGANVFDASTQRFAVDAPRSGAGELVAVAALSVAIAGLALSFSAD